MSTTTTCGMSESRPSATRMPSTAAGLWSGASALHASMSLITSGVIRVDSVNRSPPCTTRCPTAASVPSQPRCDSSASTASSAAAWPASPSGSTRLPSMSLNVIAGFSAPSRSARPDSSDVRLPVSWTANFSEDEPLLSTRIRQGSMDTEILPMDIAGNFTSSGFSYSHRMWRPPQVCWVRGRIASRTKRKSQASGRS